MGKRVRIWIMRIIAILIVAFMVVELGANIFTSNTSSKSDKTEEKTTTKKSNIRM
jgi:preprotein translocase subunit SecG